MDYDTVVVFGAHADDEITMAGTIAKISQSGVRVVGASAVTAEDWAVTLHTDGLLTLHAVSDLMGKGALSAGVELLDFVTFTPPGSMQSP